jgi:hypothetical protein
MEVANWAWIVVVAVSNIEIPDVFFSHSYNG